MILVVDDIPENLYALKKVLENSGFKVDTASSGHEALKKILQRSYILILLDVQMPGMDGFEVAETIMGSSKAKNTAIVFLSANYTQTESILKGYNQGAVDYITKPVDNSVLLAKVKTFYQLYDNRIKIQKQQEEIKELYNQQVEKEFKLTQIAFSTSHEIRKPLANILGLIDLLKVDDVKTRQELISMIQESGSELDGVIRKIVNAT